jgi:hypothetical protein
MNGKRGTPDYGNNAGKVSVTNLDTNDIAAILSSVNRIDSRGRILMTGLFQNGIPDLYCYGAGAGIAPYHRYDYSYTEFGCISMEAGSILGIDNSYFYKYFHLNNPIRLGLEIAVGVITVMPDYQIFLYMVENDIGYKACLKIRYTEHDIQINTSTGFVTIIDLIAYPTTVHYRMLKLVIDIQTGKYVRLLYGQDQYDISQYTIPQVADIEDGFGYAEVTATPATHAGSSWGLIGYFIITTDEP